MRPKVAKERKAKGRGVSLTPNMERLALKRAIELDVTFSKYVQKLIAADLEQNILVPLSTTSALRA